MKNYYLKLTNKDLEIGNKAMKNKVTTKILRLININGKNFEVIGFFINGEKVNERRRRVIL